MNDRAGVIILQDNKILLLHRKKDNQEYYCIPGGHVEPGETFEQAAVREIFEETTLRIVLDKKILDIQNQGRREIYFLAESFTGKAQLSGPEAKRNSEKNRYMLEWVSLKHISKILLYPEMVKTILICFCCS